MKPKKKISGIISRVAEKILNSSLVGLNLLGSLHCIRNGLKVRWFRSYSVQWTIPFKLLFIHQLNMTNNLYMVGPT